MKRTLGVLVVVAAIVAGGHAAIPVRSSAKAAKTAKPATYVVKKGDSLDAIARRFGTTVSGLAKANGLRNVHVVQAGTRLTVPARTSTATATSKSGATGLPSRLRSDPARVKLIPRFDHWAKVYAVPPDLLKAMTWMESGWQNHKRSSVGAHGIGQLMPDTVHFVSRNLLRSDLDPQREDDNIRMSARFLRYLLDQTGGNTPMALASYYQGLRSVRERGVYDETDRYIANITALRRQFR
jgi:soluble lytic murein transglycosylase-like protein